MIVEISAKLLVEMYRTDNVIRAVVLDGIPRDYHLVQVKAIPNGTIELWLESETDKSIGIKPIILKDLRGQ